MKYSLVDVDCASIKAPPGASASVTINLTYIVHRQQVDAATASISQAFSALREFFQFVAGPTTGNWAWTLKDEQLSTELSTRATCTYACVCWGRDRMYLAIKQHQLRDKLPHDVEGFCMPGGQIGLPVLGKHKTSWMCAFIRSKSAEGQPMQHVDGRHGHESWSDRRYSAGSSFRF